MDYKNILEKYDQFFWEEFDIDNATEEQIEEIIASEEELWKWLDSLILAYKINNTRKKKFEKREKLLKTLISWFMRRLEIEKYENDDSKISTMYYFKYETDQEKIPSEYLQISSSKIQSALRKWEKIEGIIPTDKYPSRSIR